MTVKNINSTRSKITYFFGAGASVLTGIPATVGLMNGYIRFFKNFSNAQIPTTLELVNNRAEASKEYSIARILEKYKSQKHENPTIETLYSDINKLLVDENNRLLQHLPSMYTKEDDVGIARTDDILKELKESLNKYIFDTLKPKNNFKVPYVHMIEQMYNLADEKIVTIATTNYDLLIEESCGELEINIIDGFNRKKHGRGVWNGEFNENDNEPGIKLLKLHGSLNWHRDENDDEALFCESLGRKYDNYSTWIEPAPQDKSSEKIPFKPIKEEFCNVLNETKLLIVVGFSFDNDNVWTEEVESALDDSMRLLFISAHPEKNEFIIRNKGCKLDIEDGSVKYELDDINLKKMQEKRAVDYYKITLANGNIEDAIKVMQYVNDKYLN